MGLFVGCLPSAGDVNRLDCAPPDGGTLLSLVDRDVVAGPALADPRGLVVLVHGFGEEACDWVDRTEERALADAVLAESLAWVAVDGADRAWDTALDSPEIADVDAAIEALEEDGALVPGLPTAVVGHSNGGAFAQVYARGSTRDVVGFVNANGWGTPALRRGEPLPPGIFIAAENDSVVSSRTVLDAATGAANNGHEIEVLLRVRGDLDVPRLTRIPALSASDAERVVEAWRAEGLLDSRGPATSPRTDPRYGFAVPDDLSESRGEILDQVHVAYAEHRFSAEEPAAVVRFFE